MAARSGNFSTRQAGAASAIAWLSFSIRSRSLAYGHDPWTAWVHAEPFHWWQTLSACLPPCPQWRAYGRRLAAMPSRMRDIHAADHIAPWNMMRRTDRRMDTHNHSSASLASSALLLSGAQRSGAKGTSMEPSRYLVGPSAPGIRSNSNTSVGNHNVAHALGISTTPDMWP